MTSIFDNYGEHARSKIKDEFDADRLQREIGYARRDIVDIEKFVKEAEAQLEIIRATTFKRYIEFTKGHDYNAGKVDFSVSCYRVPQVPGNEKLRVYEYDFSKRFVGNAKRAEAIEYVRQAQAKYPDAELIGNAASLIKPVKDVVQL
jgi:hypothetical protein